MTLPYLTDLLFCLREEADGAGPCGLLDDFTDLLDSNLADAGLD